MGSYVYVGNLDPSTREDSLRKTFEASGNKVKSVVILRSPRNDRSRGFGFVEVGSDEESAAAISSMNGAELDGRKLAVNTVRQAPPRGRTDGRGFQSYSGLGGRSPDGQRRPSSGSRRKSR